MSYANYRQIPALLRAREQFDGNSMMGRSGRFFVREGDWHGVSVARYIVWSYGEMIAVVDDKGFVHHNPEKFSRTTSRHQNLCKRFLIGNEADDVHVVIRKLDALAEQYAIESVMSA
jgi:hypothetical protein